MKNNKIQIAQPTLGDEEKNALSAVIDSGWLTQGPRVAEFEEAFALKHSVDHAVAVTSCTTGLHLSLVALGIGPGDEVIVPSFTWIASANAVLYCGAIPILCDIDPVTFNLDIDDLSNRVTAKTKAVIAVHLFGLCADIDRLREKLPEKIYIIEDAACAAGAIHNGRPAGSIGDLAVFSFHPRKTITTGEGGMITTSNSDLAGRLRILRNHGASVSEEQRHHGPRPHLLPDFNVLGFNYRMTDLQGALGLVQLQRLDKLIDERAHWADFYRKSFSTLSWLKCPSEPKSGRHAWQSFVTMIDGSPFDAIKYMDELEKRGISTRPGTHAVHMQAYYAEHFELDDEDFPAAKNAANNSVALPLHNQMEKSDYERVVKAVFEIAQG